MTLTTKVETIRHLRSVFHDSLSNYSQLAVELLMLEPYLIHKGSSPLPEAAAISGAPGR